MFCLQQRTDVPSEFSGILDETMQLTPTSQDIEGEGGERGKGDDGNDTMQLLTPVSMLLDRTTSGSEEGDSPDAKGRKKPAWEKEGDKKLRDQKEVNQLIVVFIR